MNGSTEVEARQEHAMVPLGEWSVPLIGVSKEATEERCDLCQELQHMTKVAILGNSRFLCSLCLMNHMQFHWNKQP